MTKIQYFYIDQEKPKNQLQQKANQKKASDRVQYFSEIHKLKTQQQQIL